MKLGTEMDKIEGNLFERYGQGQGQMSRPKTLNFDKQSTD
jgi:hypothetical protein